MKATQLLTRDHTKIKKLFSQFEAAGERSHKRRQTIATKVIDEINRHSRAEEMIFYPAVHQKGGKELQEKILEGIEEHRAADYLIDRLQRTPPEDRTFAPKFKVLMESVKHHLKEEEGKLFPKAKKVLGEFEERLGQQLAEVEREEQGKQSPRRLEERREMKSEDGR